MRDMTIILISQMTVGYGEDQYIAQCYYPLGNDKGLFKWRRNLNLDRPSALISAQLLVFPSRT